MTTEAQTRMVQREEKVWEQVVYAEVIIPNTPNVFGDVSTPEDVIAFAHAFAMRGYGKDIEHTKEHTDSYHVVESFIARPGDPDFIVGSWVLGVKVVDAELWEKILNGEINGFSYGAICAMTEIEWEDLGSRVVIGVTEPDPQDGHTHAFTAIVDGFNKVISGGTENTDGHAHDITRHSKTGYSSGHSHRFHIHTQEPDDGNNQTEG